MNTEEIINGIKKSVLKNDKKIETNLSEKIKELVTDTLRDFARNELKKAMQEELTRAILIITLPKWVEGDEKAGEIIGVSGGAMTQRRRKGYYAEGIHWKKANYKLKGSKILWSKDALLNERDTL